MALADKLRQTDTFKTEQEKLHQYKLELLARLEKRFTEHPTWDDKYYFGKSGSNKNYGMNINEFSSFLKEEGFRVSHRSNGYGVQYLSIYL